MKLNLLHILANIYNLYDSSFLFISYTKTLRMGS